MERVTFVLGLFLISGFAGCSQGSYSLSNEWFMVKGEGGRLEVRIDPQGKGKHSLLLAKSLYMGEVNPADLGGGKEWEIKGKRLRIKDVSVGVGKREGGIGLGREWNQPSRLEEGHTLGQDFVAEDGLTMVSVPCPTWRTERAGMRLTLRRDGPSGEIVASKVFVDVGDNSWQTLAFPPQPKGRYYLEMSAPRGTIGWWGRREDIYGEGRAYVDGNPVEGDRFIRLTYCNLERVDVLLSLEGNTLTLQPAKELACGIKFITPWERDGYDVSASPFYAFFSDRPQYIPIHQFKRRFSHDFGIQANEYLTARGQGDFHIRFLQPKGTINFTMDADQMTLHFPRSSLRMECNKGKGDVPSFFPRFYSSSPQLDEVLNEFLWERALSYPPQTGSPDWMEWLSLILNWMDLPGYLQQKKVYLLNYKMDPDGYVWTWGNQRCWPFPPCDRYDARHFTTNSNFILACWRYFAWTHDLEFLRANIDRIRRAMEWQLTYCKGEEGLFIDNSPDHDGTTKGVHSNYWDDIPFGYKSAYENIYFYASLNAMAQLEEVVRKESIRGQVAGRSPEYYRELARRVKENYDLTFWNEEAGRYIGCVDITGAKHDYGFTYVNMEALTYGLGDEVKAKRIYHWMENDPSDTYKYKFAPRANTLDCSGWWYLEGKAEIPAQPFDTHLENGGAILYTSFYDLMARAKYLGADNAFRRLWEILDRYQKPDKLCGGSPLYYGEVNGWQVGTDIPFPESGLVPCAFLYAFLGIDADINGLRIAPNLPSALSYAGVRNLVYRGLPLDIKVTRDGEVEIKCSKKGYEFVVRKKLKKGEVFYFTHPPKGIEFPPLPVASAWRANWIWFPGENRRENATFYFRKRFDLPEDVREAQLWITADNAYKVYINGKVVGSDGRWEDAERYEVGRLLRKGGNVIAVEASNVDGPAGLLVEMKVTLRSGKVVWILSDDSWLSAREAEGEWLEYAYPEEGWIKAEKLGTPPAGWGDIERK